jgi:hypothetical protein
MFVIPVISGFPLLQRHFCLCAFVVYKETRLSPQDLSSLEDMSMTPDEKYHGKLRIYDL